MVERKHLVRKILQRLEIERFFCPQKLSNKRRIDSRLGNQKMQILSSPTVEKEKKTRFFHPQCLEIKRRRFFRLLSPTVEKQKTQIRVLCPQRLEIEIYRSTSFVSNAWKLKHEDLRLLYFPNGWKSKDVNSSFLSLTLGNQETQIHIFPSFENRTTSIRIFHSRYD